MPCLRPAALIIAGLAGAAIAEAWAQPPAQPAARPPAAAEAPHPSIGPPVTRKPTPGTAASIPPKTRTAPAAAASPLRPPVRARTSLSPPALAAPSRPGKNPPTALGGPAKYDAKKGAMLGRDAVPHRR